jgi:hypothetical protein
VSELQLTIPNQDSARSGVRIKPREVNEWLNNLPFLDVRRTARLASQQLRLLNRQPIPVQARLDILAAFLSTYHRLGESLPTQLSDAAGVKPVLRGLCQDLGFGYKIAVNELINTRRRFGEARALSRALLGAIHALGLHLEHYYASHQRAPTALWAECLALFNYARNTGRTDYRSRLIDIDGEISIERCFRLHALLRLADPYHVAPGAIAVVHRYLERHLDLGSIEAGRLPGRTLLRIPAGAQTSGAATATLYVDVGALLKQIRSDIERLEKHRQASAVGLPADIPVTTLLQTLRQLLDLWLTERERKSPRQQAETRIDLVAGLDAAYCVVNRGRCFDPALFLAPGHENTIDLGAPQPTLERRDPDTPMPLACVSMNYSSGGIALRYSGPGQPHPRVGQLVALHRAGASATSGWIVAVCRWLQETDSGAGFEMGVQYLAREPAAVVIRAADSEVGSYRPAIAATQKRGDQRVITLIARAGDAKVGDELWVDQARRRDRVRCVELLEAGSGFERFVCQPDADHAPLTHGGV